MPYSGNYRGCFWNAQALWAARTSSQNAKFGLLARLLDTHDFAGIVETHGTDGKVRAGHLPSGTVAFWSHLSARHAGVGLILKQDFLKNFHPVERDHWKELEPGRLAVLRLTGPLGNLDLFVAYLATGGYRAADQASRRATIDTLHHSTTSQTNTLSIYMGDWNLVMGEKDR